MKMTFSHEAHEAEFEHLKMTIINTVECFSRNENGSQMGSTVCSVKIRVDHFILNGISHMCREGSFERGHVMIKLLESLRVSRIKPVGFARRATRRRVHARVASKVASSEPKVEVLDMRHEDCGFDVQDEGVYLIMRVVEKHLSVVRPLSIIDWYR